METGTEPPGCPRPPPRKPPEPSTEAHGNSHGRPRKQPRNREHGPGGGQRGVQQRKHLRARGRYLFKRDEFLDFLPPRASHLAALVFRVASVHAFEQRAQ